MKAYKFVAEDLSVNHSKDKWVVGTWKKYEGKLDLCNSGFHASKRPIDALKYESNGSRLFIVEAKGKFEKGDNKFCCSEMRLIKEIPLTENLFRRFALFCAKSCLKNYEKEYPNDKRVSNCIETVERFIDGKATISEVVAAKSSAWSASWSAAGSAAWSAAWSAAKSASWSAAESAAGSAAKSASWGAAESAQNKFLLKLIRESLKR